MQVQSPTIDQNRTASQLEGRVPTVTVIMPVRNEEGDIAATLAQVLDQSREGFELEILVVDGQSTDRTCEIVRRIAAHQPEVYLLDNPRRLSSGARNVAIRHGRGDYFLVIDGHCEIPSRTYLVDLVQAFQASGADCLGRPQPLDVTGASEFQQAVAAARASRLGHHPDSLIYSDQRQTVPALSVAIAYRRELFERVGLFDERFDACEDCELNYRVDAAGLKCMLDPRLTVKYRPRNSLMGLLRQLARYGRGRVRLGRKHPEGVSWKSFLPALFVLGVLVGPLVCYFAPPLWWIYGVVVGAYLAAVLGASVQIALRAGQPRLLAWLPLVFMAIHFGAGAGILGEFLVGLYKPFGTPGAEHPKFAVAKLAEGPR